MKELIIIAAALAALTGCATKSRSVQMQGMYASDSGTVAIGSIDVVAVPEGEESAVIQYGEDTAWLSPTTKTHEIKIVMTGTNSVASVPAVVDSICEAFVAVGAKTNAVASATK